MPPRCLVVYYEQLQRDLPAELERIAAFLQCPPELTRAPRGLRTARTGGYTCQPPAGCTRTRGAGQLRGVTSVPTPSCPAHCSANASLGRAWRVPYVAQTVATPHVPRGHPPNVVCGRRTTLTLNLTKPSP